MNKNRNENEIIYTIKQYKDTRDTRYSNDDQIKKRMEKKSAIQFWQMLLWLQHIVHTVYNKTVLIVLHIDMFSVMTLYSVISVAGSMKSHTRWEVIWLAALSLAVQFLLCEFVKQTLVEIFVFDPRGALSVLIKVRVTWNTVTVHRCWKWEENNLTPLPLPKY